MIKKDMIPEISLILMGVIIVVAWAWLLIWLCFIHQPKPLCTTVTHTSTNTNSVKKIISSETTCTQIFMQSKRG